MWEGGYAGKVEVKGHMAVPVRPTLVKPASTSSSCGDYAMQFQHEQLQQLSEQINSLAGAHLSSLSSVISQPSSSTFPYKDAAGMPAFMSEAAAQGEQAGSGLDCPVCRERGHPQTVEWKNAAREHVAAHIISQHISHSACGLCGHSDCIPALTKGKGASSTDPKWQLCPSSCQRYAGPKIYYKPALESTKCSNMPVFCEECKAQGKEQPAVVWKYHMGAHYAMHHEGKALPAEYVIAECERKYLQKLGRKL